MALSTKTLKTRIRSIKNTKKITKAMELVAAAKMRKAVATVLASRTYSRVAWETLNRVRVSAHGHRHFLLREHPEAKRVLMVLITSNRGLCGGYNSQIIVKTLRAAESFAREGVEVAMILVGKKAQQVAAKIKHQVIAVFDKADVVGNASEIYPVSRLILEEYEKGLYRTVLIGYTDFISSLRQVPKVRPILPIQPTDDFISVAPVPEVRAEATPQETAAGIDYLFEPNAEEVLAALLPRLLEVQMYQAYLEANASEHSARMMAMRNATEAADDFISDLTLNFNQARQAAITREIAEISAGKAVLE